MPVCHDCQTNVEEAKGRWVILGVKEDGFEWIFMCIQFVRDWRKRGLEREGYSIRNVKETLDKEYPL